MIIATKAIASSFTYDIQQAGYDFDQYDFKGEASYEKFVQEYREYPWKEQVGKKNGGSEPTISVKNSESKVYYWVSVIGEPDNYAYLVGIVQPKKSKSWYGKEKEVQWVSMFIAEKKETVERTFKLYFDNKIQMLNRELSKLPLFDEQEAR